MADLRNEKDLEINIDYSGDQESFADLREIGPRSFSPVPKMTPMLPRTKKVFNNTDDDSEDQELFADLRGGVVRRFSSIAPKIIATPLEVKKDTLRDTKSSSSDLIPIELRDDSSLSELESGKKVLMKGRNSVYVKISKKDGKTKFFKRFEIQSSKPSCDAKYLFDTLFSFKLLEYLGVEIPKLSVKFNDKFFLLVSEKIGECEHVDYLSRTSRQEFKSQIAKIIYAGSAICLSDLANDNIIVNPETGSLCLIDFETITSTNTGTVMNDWSTFYEDEFSVGKAFYSQNLKSFLNKTLSLSLLMKSNETIDKLIETLSYLVESGKDDNELMEELFSLGENNREIDQIAKNLFLIIENSEKLKNFTGGENLAVYLLEVFSEVKENIETNLSLLEEDKKLIDQKVSKIDRKFLEDIRDNIMKEFFDGINMDEITLKGKKPSGLYQTEKFSDYINNFIDMLYEEIEKNKRKIMGLSIKKEDEVFRERIYSKPVERCCFYY